MLNCLINKLLGSWYQFLVVKTAVKVTVMHLSVKVQLVDVHMVLYCYMLYVILTSFWVLRLLKSWSKYFFGPFSAFFVHFQPFSVISSLKSRKISENEQKKTIFFPFLSSLHRQIHGTPSGNEWMNEWKVLLS